MSDCIEDVKFNTVARACVKLFNLFGRPKHMRTDNATYLTTVFMEDLCKQLSIHHSLSTPYEHRGNTHCERGLKTLEAIICKIRDEDKNLPWSSFVQHAVYFYNVSDCDFTGYSPYQLFFGTRPTLSFELADEITPGLVEKNYQITEIKYQTRLAYNCAYSTLLAKRLKANEKYNNQVKEKQPLFKKNDKILVKKPLPNGKLDYYYDGPFVVTNADNFIVYYKKPRYKKEFRAHCCMVKLFHEPKDTVGDVISQGGVSK
uniref:Integrase catalytic domain-containing protein n=1 Tax=Strongyloides venezuelensis TaxID=75913 RepID=A0A0K0FFF8_STRVS